MRGSSGRRQRGQIVSPGNLIEQDRSWTGRHFGSNRNCPAMAKGGRGSLEDSTIS